MYTNYPNTEQITPKNDPKGSNQWIKIFSARRSAAGAWCNMIWSWILMFCGLLLFAHVKLIPEKQMLVFLTGHRHLFFLI